MDKDQAQDLIDKNQKISIRYYGGSTPNGNVREIMPLRVDGDKLVARCIISNKQKLFFLDKMTLQQDDKPEGLPDIFVHNSIESFLVDLKDDLEEMGWFVDYDRESIRLHGFLKNGKARKKHEVSIKYGEYKEVDCINVRDDGSLELGTRIISKHKPWRVSTPNWEAHFTYLEKALLCFWELAKEHKPKSLKEKPENKKPFNKAIIFEKQSISLSKDSRKKTLAKKHPATFSLVAWVRKIIGIFSPQK